MIRFYFCIAWIKLKGIMKQLHTAENSKQKIKKNIENKFHIFHKKLSKTCTAAVVLQLSHYLIFLSSSWLDLLRTKLIRPVCFADFCPFPFCAFSCACVRERWARFWCWGRSCGVPQGSFEALQYARQSSSQGLQREKEVTIEKI